MVIDSKDYERNKLEFERVVAALPRDVRERRVAAESQAVDFIARDLRAPESDRRWARILATLPPMPGGVRDELAAKAIVAKLSLVSDSHFDRTTADFDQPYSLAAMGRDMLAIARKPDSGLPHIVSSSDVVSAPKRDALTKKEEDELQGMLHEDMYDDLDYNQEPNYVTDLAERLTDDVRYKNEEYDYNQYEPDPITGNPSRIYKGSPVLFTRGISESEPGLARTRAGIQAAQQIVRREARNNADINKELTEWLRYSEDHFNEQLVFKKATPEEEAALRDLRSQFPRIEWDKLKESTGSSEAVEVMKLWSQYDKSDQNAAAFIKAIRPLADAYTKKQVDFLRENDQAYLAEMFKDIFTDVDSGQDNFELANDLYEKVLQAYFGLEDKGDWQMISAGMESIAFSAGNQRAIYKIMLNRGDGSAGMRIANIHEGVVFNGLNPKTGLYEDGINQADMIQAGLKQIQIKHRDGLHGIGMTGVPITERLMQEPNRYLGFVYSEVVGITPTGDLIIKQPEAKGDPMNGADVNKWASTQGYETLDRIKSSSLSEASNEHPVLVKDGQGNYALAIDLRNANGKASANYGVQIFDPNIKPLSKAEIDASPILQDAIRRMNENDLIGAPIIREPESTFRDISDDLPIEPAKHGQVIKVDVSNPFEAMKKGVEYLKSVFGDTVIAPDGAAVKIKSRTDPTLEGFFKHLTFNKDENGNRSKLNPLKLESIPLIKDTIRNASCQLNDKKNQTRIYVRRIEKNAYHSVVVRADGTIEGQGPFRAADLVTQFVDRPPSQRSVLPVVWQRLKLADSQVNNSAGTLSSPDQSNNPITYHGSYRSQAGSLGSPRRRTMESIISNASMPFEAWEQATFQTFENSRTRRCTQLPPRRSLSVDAASVAPEVWHACCWLI